VKFALGVFLMVIVLLTESMQLKLDVTNKLAFIETESVKILLGDRAVEKVLSLKVQL
jgi:hypothetical protein